MVSLCRTGENNFTPYHPTWMDRSHMLTVQTLGADQSQPEGEFWQTTWGNARRITEVVVHARRWWQWWWWWWKEASIEWSPEGRLNGLGRHVDQRTSHRRKGKALEGGVMLYLQKIGTSQLQLSQQNKQKGHSYAHSKWQICCMKH